VAHYLTGVNQSLNVNRQLKGTTCINPQYMHSPYKAEIY
jgi:hypothetical protein